MLADIATISASAEHSLDAPTLDALIAELERVAARPGSNGFMYAAEAVLEAFPGDAQAYLRVAAALERLGETDKALDVIDSGLVRLGERGDLLKAAAKLAGVVFDSERSIEYRLRWTDLSGEKVAAMATVGKMRLGVYDGNGAWEALEASVAAGGSRDELRMQFARAAFLKGDYEQSHVLLQEEKRLNGWSERAERLAEKLQARLRAAHRNPPPMRLGSGATDDLKALALELNLPTGSATALPDNFITEAGDLIAQRAKGSRALVLVFGGITAMAADLLPALSGMLGHAHVNALLFSDPKRLLLLAGIHSIGDYGASLGWIRAVMTAWDASALYCFGGSAGGYPAIRYGLDLGARRILTFSAPTVIGPKLITEGHDRRARAINRRLCRHVPEMCVDLRDEIARRGRSAPEIINYYGADMPEDAYHGLNIDGLPTVRSRPLAGVASHSVGRHLKDRPRNEFADIFTEFLREELAGSGE